MQRERTTHSEAADAGDRTVQIRHSERSLTPERLAALEDIDPLGQAIIRPHLHHVNFKTTRPEEMIEWYRVVVGVHVVKQTAGGAWLSNDASNHRIALVTRRALGIDFDPDHERHLHDGLLHIAWEYGTLDCLLSSYARLRELSILPWRAVHHGPTVSFYYEDPDGNQVELQYDAFGDWARSMEFMRSSPAFEEDPFGPDVDPTLMLQDRKQGVSTAEVLRRSYAGEYQTEDQREAQLHRRRRASAP